MLLANTTWSLIVSPGPLLGLSTWGRMVADQVSGLRLEVIAFDDAGTTLLCDISTGQPCWLVNENQCIQYTFETVHWLDA